MTNTNVQQATDKLEVLNQYRAIMDKVVKHTPSIAKSIQIATKQYNRETKELWAIYDRMTEEEKKEMEATLNG